MLRFKKKIQSSVKRIAYQYSKKVTKRFVGCTEASISTVGDALGVSAESGVGGVIPRSSVLAGEGGVEGSVAVVRAVMKLRLR